MTGRRDPSDWSSGALAGLLTLAMFVSTFSVAAVSALGPFVTATFDLSGTAFGALSSAIFLTAAVASPSVGRWVDGASARRTTLVLFGVSGVSFAFAAAALSFSWLLAAMAATGLAVAFGNPVTNAILSRRRLYGRGWLVGIKQAGQPVNMIVAGATLPFVAATLSWRVAFGLGVVIAVVGLAWVAGAVPAVAHEPLGLGGAGRTPAPKRPRGAVLALSGYAFLMGSAMPGFAAYLPLYGYEELGVAPGVAGTATAMIGVAGAASRVAWGRVAESARSSAWPLVVVALGAIAGVLLVAAATPPHSWLLWAGAGVFGATGHSWNAAGTVAVLRESNPATIGRASGAVQLAFFVGLTLSPVMVGSVKDLAGSLRPAFVVLICAYALAAAIAAVWGVRGRHRVAGAGQDRFTEGSA